MKNLFIVATAMFALASTTRAAVKQWEIDPQHSAVTFKIRHMMVSNVRGSFKEFSGTLGIDDADVTKNTVDVTINPASIDTTEAKRDAHLKSEDFFDVNNHKTITYKTKKVTKGKGNTFKLIGDLTMHGVTKEVTFDVTELATPQKNFQGNLIRGMSATGSLNRKDFGMTWNKTIDKGGIAVGDKVDVNVELELFEKKTEEKKS